MAGCCCRVLLPHLSPVVIDRINQADDAVVIAAHPRATRVAMGSAGVCRPGCTAGTDVSWGICLSQVGRWWCGLTVRRFFCDHVDCSAGTFVEQMPGLTERCHLSQYLAHFGLTVWRGLIELSGVVDRLPPSLSQLTGLQGRRANAARTSTTPKSTTRLRHVIRPFTT
jgi:hypothetical protein